MSSSSQNPDPQPTTDRVVIDVDRDGWTNGLQLNIVQLDEDGGGHGYRLSGPKYNGSSRNLLRCELEERDAREIRAYLDAVFPQERVDRAAVLNEAVRYLRQMQREMPEAARDSAHGQGVLHAALALDELAAAARAAQSGGAR